MLILSRLQDFCVNITKTKTRNVFNFVVEIFFEKGGIKIYLKQVENNNMIYSLDMLRLKTYLSYTTFTSIEFRFETVWKKYIGRKWTTGKMTNFFYNYNIEISEEQSFYFGFLHNTEKRESSDRAEYNFTIEFNPNKLKDNKIIMYLLSLSGEWYIRSLDIAVDLKVNILDLVVDFSGRQEMTIKSRGYDNKTIYFGKDDGRVKVYNKKRESKLDMIGELTRVELTKTFEDFPVRSIKIFKMDECFPSIYLNNYIYSLSDYKDKTLLAILYAVQNGFPVKDLTRVYKEKIKKLLEGGYKIKFSTKAACEIVRKTIFYYFINNPKIRWL